MPVIPPPSDDYEEPSEPVQQNEWTWEQRRRVEIFLDVKPWKCPVCNLTNFGRNLQCASWTCKFPRPANYSKRRGLG